MSGVASLTGYFERHPDPALGDVVFAVVANNHIGDGDEDGDEDGDGDGDDGGGARDARCLRDAVDEVVALVALARTKTEDENGEPWEDAEDEDEPRVNILR